MSREIKFRAWNGATMFNVDQITFNDAIWSLTKGMGVSVVYQPHIELMQFTGLRDKNGKEVYSGDIFKDERGIVRTIFDVPGGFAFESHPKAFGYGFQNNTNPTESLSDKQTASWFESACKIIGNIHENLDLLEGKEDK